MTAPKKPDAKRKDSAMKIVKALVKAAGPRQQWNGLQHRSWNMTIWDTHLLVQRARHLLRGAK